MLKVRNPRTIMTSYQALASRQTQLAREKGFGSVPFKVLTQILRAVHAEVLRYSDRTRIPYSRVSHYACEVDLSCRHYKVTVFPYVYDHPGVYYPLDGLDLGYKSKLYYEKES